MQPQEIQNIDATAKNLDNHIQNYGLKNGETLKTVQRKLNDLGHNSGKVDGLIGPNTRRGLESFMEKYGNISTQSKELIQAELEKNKTKGTESSEQSRERVKSAVKIEGEKLVLTETIKASGNKDKLPDLTGYYHDSENDIGVKVDSQGNITNLTKYGITGTYNKENQTATYNYRGKTYTQIEIKTAPQVMPDGPGTRISERQGLRAVDYDSRTKTAATYVNDLIQIEENGVFKNNELYTGEVRNIKTGEVLETYEKGKLTYSNNPGTIVATMSKQ